MSNTTTSKPSLTPEQIDQYRRDGYVVVPDVLTPAEIDGFIANDANPKEEWWKLGLRRHTVDPVWRKLTAHPRVAGFAAQLLGGHPMVVQTMYLKKPPGGTGIAPHQDTHYLPSEPNTLMACWIALTDTDPGNGGFCVVPRSHKGPLLEAPIARDAKEHVKWETVYPMRDRAGRTWGKKMWSFQVNMPEESIVRLTIPRGAAIFFHGMLVHGSFANKDANRPRLAWAVHYVREGTWLLRQDVQELVAAE